ncbi:DUF4335 domain-containing protein [Trichocoleus sp. FACHB-262]|nr:DUF4335 domain-containing protein [Trichocoleus sp. FACHB-262]
MPSLLRRIPEPPMPFLSTSVLRRYTPPTCTLEIVANDSPLSRWAGRPLLRKLRFHLSLDDPRLTDSEQVSLRGDRFQLDELSDAVSAYVQDFLNQSPALISAGGRSSVATLEAPPLVPPPIDLNAARSARTAALSVIEPEPDALSTEQSGELASAAEAAAPSAPLVLESPRIFLEPQGLLSHRLHLGSLASGLSRPFITLSATQLADLATALDEYAADAMALPELNQRSWVPVLPAWAPTAAAVLLTAGVTAGVVKSLDQPTPELKTAVSLSTPQATGQQAMVPGQVATGPLGVPAPPQMVPPPPPAGALKSGLPIVPVPDTAAPNAIALAPVPPAPAGASSTPAPTTNKPIASIPVESGPVALAPQAESAPQLELENVPEAEPVPPPPAAKLPTLDAARNAAAPEAAGETARSGAEAAQAPAADEAADSAFDSIPQVAEVRSYFEERWQPPEGLTQTLEYTLLIGADGSIQRIVPLGQSAGDYIDRTGMPLVGEAFVTPIQGGQPPRVRVVLSPDGQVRTFLE